MLIQISVATEADRIAIEEILSASYPALMLGSYEGALLARALPLMTRANPKLLRSGSYYLATVNGVHVGSGGWSRDEPGSGQVMPYVGHVRHFAVDASYTGLGIGRALYKRCIDDARQSEIRQLMCYSNLNGEAFYASLGFEAIGPIDIQIGEDVIFPSKLMICHI